MGAQVVDEDDVTFAQRRCEDLLDIREERRSVHRAVDGIGCRHSIDVQGCDQGWGFPVPVVTLATAHSPQGECRTRVTAASSMKTRRGASPSLPPLLPSEAYEPDLRV